MKHACGNPRCPDRALVGVDKLACPKCWAELPQTLQDRIVETHRQRPRGEPWRIAVVAAREHWRREAADRGQTGGVSYE